MRNEINNTSKKKTKKDHVIELYNAGEKNPKVIAEKVGTTLVTVYTYLGTARKEGKIEKKPKTKKEQVIELYNSGEKNPQIIAEKAGITVKIVNSYLRKAGKIKSKPKNKTKKEHVIELYNAGEKNPKVIAEKVGITVNAAGNHIYRARKEGKIGNKPKTKKEQVLELYNSGEKNPKVIAENVGTTVRVVDGYLREARNKIKKEQALGLYNAGEKDLQVIAEKIGITVEMIDGYLREVEKTEKIERGQKNKTKKEQVIELYNAGEKSLKVLSEKVGVTVRSVSTFLYEARKEGKIEKAKTRIEQVVELYNSGYRDVRSLAEILGVKVEVASNYLNKAEKMGKIEKRLKDKTKKEQAIELYNAGEKNRKIIAEKVGSTVGTVSNYLYEAGKEGKIKNQKEESSVEETLKDKVKILLETKYPREIAEQLKVPPIMIYDVIDSLDKDYINKLKVKKVKNNPLYPKIAYLREAKNSSIENVLYTLLKTNLSLDDKINLAKIYYILGNENVPERLLNEVIFYKTASLEIINRAIEERDKILLEIKSRKIREELKKERNISADYLCKKYNVRTSFLTDLIGTGHENVIFSEPCI